MKPVAFSRIVSVNNEIKGYSAENLLTSELAAGRSWLCEKGFHNGSVILALEFPAVLTAVHIKNAHSAFVEVLVGNDMDRDEDYQTLVRSSLFMSPHESVNGIDSERERLFGRRDFCSDTADKKWKFVRIVCKQPYNDRVPFGISFVRVSGSEYALEESECRSSDLNESKREVGTSRDGGRKKDVSGSKRRRDSVQQQKKMLRKGRRRSFSRLMEDVVFVISGIGSPQKKELRRQMLEMGASYSSKWHADCTHLICSRRDTAEFNKVTRKGKIAKEEWIRACYEDRKRYPWRRYALDENEAKMPESEEEISSREDDDDAHIEGWEESAGTSAREGKTQPRTRESEDPYVTDTDEECEKPDTTDYPMPYLPNFFVGKSIYVDPGLSNCYRIERYIVAYGGIVTESLTEDVEFYVTGVGGAILQIFRKKAPKMRAVRPAWIWEINCKSEWTSPWKFLL